MKDSIKTVLASTILLGGLYSVSLIIVGRVVSPNGSKGFPVIRDNQIVGLRYLGQAFERPEYFWGRPDAYQTKPASADQVAATSQRLYDLVKRRRNHVLATHPEAREEDVPLELLTGSGSGVDPDISPRTLSFQIPRVVKARSLKAQDAEALQEMIDEFTKLPQMGFLGEPIVNVLAINLALDERFPMPAGGKKK